MAKPFRGATEGTPSEKIGLNPLQLFRSLVTQLDTTGIPYMLTGAFAVSFYGRPRASHDIDLVVELLPEAVPRLVKALSKDYFVDEDMVREAIERQNEFNVIHRESAMKVDFWMLTGTRFDRERFARRRRVEMGNFTVWVSAPEDLILIKLVWFKESQVSRHREEAQGIVEIQPQLDRDYLDRWAEELGVADHLKVISQLSSSS